VGLSVSFPQQSVGEQTVQHADLTDRSYPHRARPLGRHTAHLHPLHSRRVPQLPRRRRLRQRLGRRYV